MKESTPSEEEEFSSASKHPLTKIIVLDYDPAWAKQFDAFREKILPIIGDCALTIEHVGSTSVPGLAAKPVIDMDIEVQTPADTTLAIKKLEQAGYQHLGNMGIEGREAPPQSVKRSELSFVRVSGELYCTQKPLETKRLRAAIPKQLLPMAHRKSAWHLSFRMIYTATSKERQGSSFLSFVRLDFSHQIS